jgi:[DsrC]-trisulfide reductase subunit P
MFEKAFSGSRRYWGLVGLIVVLIGIGGIFYLRQLSEGLQITGLARSVGWGFYVAQFTFLVGVAASAVMVVLPYYLHNYKAFSKVVILGEFLAISSVSICVLFILVDLGQPARGMNVMFFPTPNSMLFWDGIVLSGYLLLNATIGFVSLGAERRGVPPPNWIKPVIILSIPWAVSIHTVTAFIYCGLPGRGFWLTAILAPRFLASAFASGPSLLILLCLLLRKFTRFRVADEPIKTLSKIVVYGMLVNLFFVLMEIFTALYSGIPEHAHHWEYLFFGLEGKTGLVPWMWTSQILAVTCTVLLLFPRIRERFTALGWICGALIISIWIDKGMGMVIGGQVPDPTGHVVEYSPTFPEIMITLGVYGIGALILTFLYKVAVGVREEKIPVNGGTDTESKAA